MAHVRKVIGSNAGSALCPWVRRLISHCPTSLSWQKSIVPPWQKAIHVTVVSRRISLITTLKTRVFLELSATSTLISRADHFLSPLVRRERSGWPWLWIYYVWPGCGSKNKNNIYSLPLKFPPIHFTLSLYLILFFLLVFSLTLVSPSFSFFSHKSHSHLSHFLHSY